MASALLAIAIAFAPAVTDSAFAPAPTSGFIGRSQPRLRRTPPSMLASNDVPTPAMLEDILHDDRNLQATATPPNALKVFRKVLSYVWAGSLGARLMALAALSSLVTSKYLNVLVPFTLKRAVDSLEASLRLGQGGVSSTVPLLVLYAATRLGVAFANEIRTIAFTRVSQRSQYVTEVPFAKMPSDHAACLNEVEPRPANCQHLPPLELTCLHLT